ncbi:MAG: NUDIX hydrolase [Chloroflexi bacterium]|jgi:ADP-ribose pyrophosphatase YjhB (NUDIX family)|nr:NUDIX hydrolase [Chloroflexota bacterium]
MNIINRITTTYHRLIGGKYNKSVKRRQFNLTMNEDIIEAVRFIAAMLEVPLYVACEHLLQVGSYHLLEDLNDLEKRERLKEHLIDGHLLGRELNEDELLHQANRDLSVYSKQVGQSNSQEACMFTGITVWTVVVNPADKKTLLIKRPAGDTWGNLWIAPGGKVEKSDLKEKIEFSFLEKSAIRETKEETNIDVAIVDYVGSFASNVTENNKGKILFVVYFATPITFDLKPQKEEVAAIGWFTINEANDLPLVEGTSTILQQVYKEKMWETAGKL